MDDNTTPITFAIEPGRAVPLAEINARLEPTGMLLIVGTWEGKGERTPTTLEVMPAAEFQRRCDAKAKRNAGAPDGFGSDVRGAIRAAIEASDNDGGSASDAIQDMLLILEAALSPAGGS